jgi:hypothetical protein
MHATEDEDFIARTITSRSSTAQVGVQYECNTHYFEFFDMSLGKNGGSRSSGT